MKCYLRTFLSVCALLAPVVAQGQGLGQGPQTNAQTGGQYFGGLPVGAENLFVYAAVNIEVKGPNGAPISGPVYVSLVRVTGEVFKTVLAEDGKASFSHVPKSELTAQVVAAGYETAKRHFQMLDNTEVKLQIDLQPMSDKEAAATDRGISALKPKAQRDIGKALEALRVNRPADARNYLESAQRNAPESAEVEYLFGVYASLLKNPAQAQTYWIRALELNPRHLSSLLAVSQGLLQERKATEAMPYLSRALEVEPSSWRAHMLMGQACLFQGMHEEAVKQAERAIELGHERAASAQPLLAHALYVNGDKQRGTQVLEKYVAEHPTDANAAKLLERFTTPTPPAATGNGVAEGNEASGIDTASGLVPVPSNWLPPDVDEKIPPVEEGANCPLNEVLNKAGSRIEELVHDVDRFAATETLTHESINRYGVASAQEKRKFDYLVSIQDIRHSYLGVTEYRNGGGGQAEFPDGIVTNGLPALVLIFHPYYVSNYEMTCEGLARANGRLAWQVHFRQLAGKPNAIKNYQIGVNGPSYSVGLKGRAWISADNYQIVRLETDILAPMPQIKLLAEHTTVEYDAVKFRQNDVNLWLPQSAEVYFAWRGRQVHRRHGFSNYLLYGVDAKERITAPKGVEMLEDKSSNEAPKP